MNHFANRIAQLDKEIHELEARLVTLRATRNSLLPINQIPVEILLKIFGCLGKGKGNLRLDTLVMRSCDAEAQRQLVEQEGVIRLKTMVSCSFGSDERDRHLSEIVTTIIESSGLGSQVYIVFGPSPDHTSTVVPLVEQIGRLELCIPVHKAQSILDILTYLNVDSTLDALSVLRIYRREDYNRVGHLHQHGQHELSLDIARLIAKIPSPQHVHLRAPFDFIDIFLSCCVKPRQGSGGLRPLETVTIETDHPFKLESVTNTIETGHPVLSDEPPLYAAFDEIRKPIQTLLIGVYDGFAERVVCAGTDLYFEVLGLGILWIRLRV